LKISNDRSTAVVHGLRARSDAIVVGMGTVREDDPLLLARGVDNARPLLRAVIGADDLVMGGQLLKTTADSPVVLYLSAAFGRGESPEVVELIADGLRKMQMAGIEVVQLEPVAPHRLSLSDVLHDLWRRGATHVLVEPGPTLAGSFLNQGLVDRLWVFRSPKPLAELVDYTPVRYRDKPAPAAAAVPASYGLTGRTLLDGDHLTEYLNPVSPVCFASAPSADFVLIAS
jgi:diaminohydroxyphosphoribosylaminopyrimidine deaminase/5-amino-6-(5-phosphoribosylamino)uracil reductase